MKGCEHDGTVLEDECGCGLPVCWLARFSDRPCEGRLVRAHLVRQQVLRREVGPGASGDRATWVWSCGGLTGVGGHHGMLDFSMRLRVPRSELPPELELFAVREGIVWWLDKRYGGLG